ncbi:TPA: DNA-binding transcriptional regulator [Kluyvera ascorbata]|nr:DNA-binding transcriptional regulator [Kluyvera ascorbata]HCL5622419.1 DNA-binding transcriptional regulator [Kluyvera ascorbata]HED3202385.1 DNA-binding transcriptional regulator [Kluyvera ascorbata]HED4088673.1 DNA-binding transcriptional regulator [Kluyvera ascorbata]
MDYNDKPENKTNLNVENDTPQIFRTLRNIDLNLLTIFEAVYVHKGIVNAAKILNLTPSAISQSIQKLRLLFPDPLFIRKGQGVTPTAYATHLHEYISQGLESILGALDLNGSYDKQRVIYQIVKKTYPQVLLRNVAVTDANAQLSQFQTDLIIDNHEHNNPRTLGRHSLFSDRLVLVCRNEHPAVDEEPSLDTLMQYEHTLLTMDGAGQNDQYKRIRDMLPDRQVSVSSYNLFTIASLIASSNLIGIMPLRFYHIFKQCWPLKTLDFEPLQQERVDFSLHYNKLSLRDPVMQNIINVIHQAF